MNSADFSDGGLTDVESRQVAQMLDQAGVDLIELSGGTYESMKFYHQKESTKKREAFFIEFAEQMKPLLKNAVICTTGGFRSASAMSDAIEKGATQSGFTSRKFEVASLCSRLASFTLSSDRTRPSPHRRAFPLPRHPLR
jgi:2,4-dienoyl-CoA reductase-like NADH-dependent reductase (Old Yellow Enzyme family)